jgi:tetratricopeptide (TPR) repeat protein
MKKKLLFILELLILIITLNMVAVAENFSIVEEDKSFWDTLLSEKSIINKNLLYASYIAYKDRLNDLSIETFKECQRVNSSNSIIAGISDYYIGKNLYFVGKYKDAIARFLNVNNYNLEKYNYIKIAALLNTAIVYHKLGDEEKFRNTLQQVISQDITGNYKKQALNILSSIQ